MVTILITAILAATVGTFFVKLLSLQEKDREEAYIRETLCDICAYYADYASIGSSFSVGADGKKTLIAYRQETGGVALETGRVSRVAYLTLATNSWNRVLDMNTYSIHHGVNDKIFGYEKQNLTNKISRILNGDATLLTLSTGKLKVTNLVFSVSPLRTTSSQVIDYTPDEEFPNFYAMTNAVFARLSVRADYLYRNAKGAMTNATATAERVVRLWNHE